MTTSRRKFLKLGTAGLAGWVISSTVGRGKVNAQDAVSVAYPPLIVSRRVSKVPLDYLASEWGVADPLRLSLAPQLVVKPKETSGEPLDLLIRSVHDGERVGFLLESLGDWGKKETTVGRTDNYADAMALQLVADITSPIPYFAMGEVNNEVIIYQWKSEWEFSPNYDVDEEFPGMVSDFYPFAGKGPGEMVEGSDYGKEGQGGPSDRVFNTGWAAGSPKSNPELKQKTSIEKLVASGFGNLHSDTSQDGTGKGVWENAWHVIISFPRVQSRYKLQPGFVCPISFAAWHGHHGNRGAQKHVSTWSSFVLERKVLNSLAYLAVTVAAVLGALEWIVFRRRRKAKQEEVSG